MWKSPCMNCERKGCGAYHDQCKKFQAAVKQRDTKKRMLGATRSKELLIYDDVKYRVKRFRAGSR